VRVPDKVLVLAAATVSRGTIAIAIAIVTDTPRSHSPKARALGRR